MEIGVQLIDVHGPGKGGLVGGYEDVRPKGVGMDHR